ncbi:MAG: YabP/YqfC family sporulation protein [Clostridia bacterium]|nr:YabP/YqfC family sporulation protein [Clostridia bacterium]
MGQKELEVQKLILEDRKHLSLSGVEAVDGFSEQCLKLTVSGSKVVVLGNNIKISAFNKQTGNLTADGDIFEIKYSHKNQPLIKRLFK